MRLLTYFEGGQQKLGALAGESVVDLFAALTANGEAAPSSMKRLIEEGPIAWDRAAEVLARAPLEPFLRPLQGLKLGAPVPNPSKIIAIGMNYADHAREQGKKPPEKPIIFAKYPTTVIGPGDEIRWDPALSNKVDWEVELAVIIGRTARRVAAADAYEYVFGYTVANDVTARDLQDSDGQWVRSKSLDTFCPLGPWIVTRDEIPEPHGLQVRCLVNGEVVQDSKTDQLIFRIPQLVEHLSLAFTLLPGDLILTGTPPGVGHHRKPPQYLGDGDVVTVEIEGIGSLTNPCRTE